MKKKYIKPVSETVVLSCCIEIMGGSPGDIEFGEGEDGGPIGDGDGYEELSKEVGGSWNNIWSGM